MGEKGRDRFDRDFVLFSSSTVFRLFFLTLLVHLYGGLRHTRCLLEVFAVCGGHNVGYRVNERKKKRSRMNSSF